MNTSGSSSAGKRVAIIGALLSIIPPFIAIGITIIEMIRAFSAVDANGIGEPNKLAAVIGQALIVTAIGIRLAFIGWILLVIALTALRYRARWFFWFNIIYGILLMLGFLLAAIDPTKNVPATAHVSGDWRAAIFFELFGLFLLVFSIVKRREFFLKSPTVFR